MLKKSPFITSSQQPVAQAALLLCMSLAVSAQAQTSTNPAPAATLEFVQGAVSVRSSAGLARAAQRGTQVANGETVETQNGRAQMRMVDGAFISLQNDTALRLDNYRVANAAESESALMSLVRGGLRTVTGLIGRSNKSNYRLQTATATVGIRGTGFSATSGDDGTRVRVSEGAVALCTQGGCLDLASQQSGFAPSSATLPIRIAQAPVLSPTPAPSVVVIAPQQEQKLVDVSTVVESQRPPEVLPPAFPPRIPLTGTATGLGVAYDKLISSPPNVYGMNAGLVGGALTFDAEGRLLEFVDGTGYFGYRTTAATISDFGSDGIIAWGRWNGGTKTDGINPTDSLSHFNYVTGNSGATVPIVGTYNVFGSTAPVAINSSTGGLALVGASNSVTGNMSINFPGASGGSVSYNLNIPLGGQTFNLTGSATQYASTNFLGTSSTITSTGSACAMPCAGTIPYGDAIQGAVFGVGNTRVGAQYGFSSGIGIVTGAVVLK